MHRPSAEDLHDLMETLHEGVDILKQGLEEGKELFTRGFIEMVIKGNNDWKSSFEIREECRDHRARLGGPLPGDLIAVRAIGGLVRHYGVHVSAKEVIHFQKPLDGSDRQARVRVDSLTRFLGDEDTYWIVDCTSGGQVHESFPRPQSWTGFMTPPHEKTRLLDRSKWDEFKLYSAEETIARARSHIGHTGYHVLFENCEHFAVWCKTGRKESSQVRQLMKVLSPDP